MGNPETAAASGAEALHFLGGMQSVVPRQTVLACPQDGVFALFCVLGPGMLNEGRNAWRLSGEAVVFVRAGRTLLLRASAQPLGLLDVIVGTDPRSAEGESGVSVFAPKRAEAEPPSGLFAALLGRLPCEGEDTALKDFFSRLAAELLPFPPSETQAPDSIRLLKEILDTRYSEKLTLDMLADELHWNKYKLEKDFKKYYRCPPFEYLTSVRLDAACRLLRGSDLSVVGTGLAVGLENTSYFIRMFKRRTGMSPLKYRAFYAKGVRTPGPD